MRGRLVFSGLIVIALICPNLLGLAGAADQAGAGSPAADGAKVLPVHTMSLQFDAWASKESYLGQEWDLFQIGGCVEQGLAGQPRIPTRVVHLELPSPLARTVVRFGGEERFEGVRLEPRTPNYLAGLGTFDTGRPLLDERAYAKDGPLPAASYRVERLGQGLNDEGQRLWAYNLVLSPLRYYPNSGEVVLFTDCEVDLYYDDTPSFRMASRAPQEKYIVITTNAINASGALANLITWKTAKGLSAKVYTVENISAAYPGYDDAEKIRNFLKDRYMNSLTDWVQLVGDYDAVPTRFVVNPKPVLPYDDGWIPTDAYYANLDTGSSWDYNGNHIFGEVTDANADGVYEYNELDDSIPEVWVARFASNSTGRIQSWASNVVSYERSSTTDAWKHSALAVAPDAGGENNAGKMRTKMEEYITKSGGYYGYLAELYGSGNVTRLFEANSTLSRAALVSALNSGTAFVTWMALGTNDSISSNTLGTLYNSTNVGTMTNGVKKPMVFGLSSFSAAFDGEIECLGEAFTENNLANGAIGYVGPSRTVGISTQLGYGINYNSTGMMMDFLYQMQLGKTFNPNNLYMGRTLGNAKWAFNSSWSLHYEDALKAFYLFNCLGETNTPIIYDTPKDLDPYVVISDRPTEKIVSLKARNAVNGAGLNHSLVCIYNTAQGIYAAAETDESGMVNLSIPSGTVEGAITVTRPGWRPAEATYALQDTWPPVTVANVTPAAADGQNGWYKTTPSILLRTEPNATTFYNWDDYTTFLPYTGQVLTAPEGDHQLYYWSQDFAGNKESWKSTQFQVDASVPNSTLVVSPAAPDGENGWYRTQPSINFTINHTLGTVVVRYRWEDNPLFENWTPESGPILGRERIHTLTYFAMDFAGNREPQREASFKVDSVVPTSTIVVNPTIPDGNATLGWYRTQPSITIIPDSTDEGTDRIVFHWDTDEPQNYSGLSFKALEGVHVLYWQAMDDAGNAEPLRNVSLKVDTKAPATSLVTVPSAPDGANGWYISNVTLTIAPGENATAYYKWDLAPLFTCATEPLTVPEGTHTLTYYSKDLAGNQEANRVQIFRVDTVPPAAVINITPVDKGMDWYIKRPRVKFDTTEPGAGVFYYWDDQATAVQRYSKEFEVPEGDHVLHYYAKDDAGNKELEQLKPFKVDSILPIVTITSSSPVITEGETVTFNLSGIDANGVREYIVDFGDGNSSDWKAQNTFTHAYTTPGNYSISARGRDPAGNEGRSSIFLLEVKAIYVPPPPPPPPDEPVFDWLPVGLGIVVVVAVIGVAAYAISRRSRVKWPEDMPDQREERERRKATMPAWSEGEETLAAPTSIEERAEAGYGAGYAAEAAAEAPAAAATTPSGARTMTCPKCGNEVEADADYCYTCGERFGKKKTGGPDADLYKEAALAQQPAKEAPAPKPPPPPRAARSPQVGRAAAPRAPMPTAPARTAPAAAYGDVAPAEITEAPAEPVGPAAAPAPSEPGSLDDIMSRLESISHPALAPPARPSGARPAAAGAAVAHVAARAGARPAAPAAAPKPSAPAAGAPEATVEGGSGKPCPKCETEMVRLVELPGPQNEQLKKLNAKGQHAFQCRKCGHFEISKWP